MWKVIPKMMMHRESLLGRNKTLKQPLHLQRHPVTYCCRQRKYKRVSQNLNLNLLPR